MTEGEFNVGDPIAYFLTWTTYGTWLPGDERGWWRRGDGIRHDPDRLIKESAKSDLRERPVLLSRSDRTIVRATIERHCEIREWFLHAADARSNHVHVVVTATGYPPVIVRDQLKAWCTRKLKAGHKRRQRFWTEGASCRWINQEEDLESAIQYVNGAQDLKHLDL